MILSSKKEKFDHSENPKEKELPPKPKQEEEEEKEREKNTELDKDDENDDEESDEEETTVKNFIFERPTQPPIPDDSNTTMVSVLPSSPDYLGRNTLKGTVYFIFVLEIFTFMVTSRCSQ